MLEPILLIPLLVGIILGIWFTHSYRQHRFNHSSDSIINAALTQSLAQSKTDGYIIVDNNGKIFHINDAIEQTFNIELHQLIGQPIETLLPEIKFDENHKLKAYINNEQQMQADASNNKPLHVSLSVNEIVITKQCYYLLLLRDISNEVQMYKQIVHQRNKFETLFDNCPDGIIYTDHQQHILDANIQFLSLYGSSIDQIQGQRITDLYQSQTPELNHIRDLLININENWDQEGQLAKLNCPEKHDVTVLVSYQEVKQNQENHFIYVLRDISQELKLISRIVAKNQTQELSEALVKMGYWRFDVTQKKLWCSNQIFQLLQIKKQHGNHISLSKLAKLITPEQQTIVTASIEASLNHYEPISLSLPISINQAGQSAIRHIIIKGSCELTYGKLNAIYGVVQDITERKHKESELELFKQIIESSDQAIMVFNQSNQLIYANPTHQTMHLLKGELSQYGLDDFYISNNPNQSLNQAYWSGEVNAKRLDGSQFPVHLSINQFHHPASHQQYRFATSYDISEQLKQNQMLNQAKVDAEAANRAKSDFLANMSHELRTPLNAILGFSQLLMRKKDNQFDDKNNENIAAIYHAGEHLLTLINGILDLAKIESGSFSPMLDNIEIDQVLHEAIDMVTPQAQEQGLCLQTRQGNKIPILYRQHKIPVIYSDFVLVKQALLNYLSNAINYNHDKGVIFIAVDVNENDKMARITVYDNGIGISEDKIDHVFTPFNRLGQEHSSIQGSGIGLAITKKNIENLGGTVGLTSQIDVGSSFWFELPYLSLKPVPYQAKHNHRGEHIVLYIEENQANQSVLEEFFSHLTELQLIGANTLELATVYIAEYQPKIILINNNIIDKQTIEVQNIKMQSSFYDGILISVGINKPQIDTTLMSVLSFDEHLQEPVNFDNLQSILNRYQSTD